MSWFSDLFGFSDDKQTKPPKPYYYGGPHNVTPNGKSNITSQSKKTIAFSEAPKIIDSRRINVVKAHSIVGAVDRRSNIKRYSQLINWLKQNEKQIAYAALTDGPNMPNHTFAIRPAVPNGSIAYGPGCFLNLSDQVYVLGDTHGDIESLAAIIDTIIDTCQYASKTEFPTIYLLGDILDRATEGCMLESVLLLAIMQKALPDEFATWNNIKLGIIKGDHDIAISYPETYSPEARFSSIVIPADYTQWLNDRLNLNPSEDNTLIGRAWIRLMKECPSAAFIDKFGALLSHGGIPRIDIQTKIKNDEEPYLFLSNKCSNDYEWCRMVDVKNKLLNRSSKTSEIGFQEFESFNELFDGRIKKFIFGHQHPNGGFERYSKFFKDYDAICISSFRDDSSSIPSIPHFCKLTANEVNVYSLSPAIYVVRLEENSIEHKKVELKK
jgi:hypothetical protein